MTSTSSDESAASVSPADAADIIGQVTGINELEAKFLDIINLFPHTAPRQLATQKFMECAFWLSEALGDNP